jgi:BirA family biotin operon repressor/biotin-[acetyl-CoA-carboxylase] ligase
MSPGDALDADALQQALSARVIGQRVIVLEQTTSTNDAVAELAERNSEGLVVFADRQTAGRGQYGRRWESVAQKGLWFSILLRPPIAVGEAAGLTDLLARAIAATMQSELGVAPTLKRPNDVYLGERKVAGVLLEMRVDNAGDYFAVAGLGVNVNHDAADFPQELRGAAGSLAMAAGRPVHRAAFALALLRQIDDSYDAFTRTRRR